MGYVASAGTDDKGNYTLLRNHYFVHFVLCALAIEVI